MSSVPVVCSVCHESIDSEDGLQQHRLISCPGYDPDQPRSKLSSTQQPVPSLSPPQLTEAPSGPKQYCSVKFMWQPLTEITYPKITLLAAFENGTVDLLLDSEGGHYESSYINTEKGKFEGQLVIGDSFCHPVKDFTIEKDDVIVLELQATTCNCAKCRGVQSRTDEQSTQGGSGGQYKIIYFYTTPTTEEPSGDFDLYQSDAPLSGTGRARSLQSYPRALDNKSHDPGSGRGTTSSNIDINAPHNALPSGYKRPSTLPSSTVRQEPANQSLPGNRTGRGDPFYPSNPDLSSVAPPTGPSSTGVGGGWSGSYSMDRVQRRSEVRAGGDLQGLDLQEQLRRAQEEKEAQRVAHERATTELQEQIQRLQGIIEFQARRVGVGVEGGGGAPTSSQLFRPENQLGTLTDARQKSEQELKEYKDRVAALEHQMEEYVSAMKDQTSAIQGALATNKTRSAEMVKLQHQSTHLTQYMQKQQAEYVEALNSLRKKADKLTEENIRLQQLNVTLSSELEDCRSQMKRLLEELRQKGDEMIHLQERTASSSNPGANLLELETMRQKYEVWREEASKISPLLEEVEDLREQNKHLEATVAELKATPPSAETLPEQDAYSRKSSSEYDRLMERLTELQETRVKLEGELGPLREERAATLQELSQLREMVKHPERYEKLREENSSLKEQCGQLQEMLQAERGNNQRQKEANKQLTQKLQDTTNPEQLQTVKERLERYRQERDVSRQQVEELQKQLGQLALASQQRHSEAQSYVVDRLQAESEDDRTSETEGEVHSKMQVEDTSSLSCNDPGGTDDHSISPSMDDPQATTSSPATDAIDSLDPTLPSGAQANVQGVNRRQNSNKGGADAGKPSPARSQSSTSSEPFSAQVNTKNGIKTMLLCKLTNPRKTMKVVAKRAGPGEYDAGTIRYVGKIEGSPDDYVGIELDLPGKAPTGSKGDGTYKGKQYFKCPAGYGIYVPLAKVYIEQQH